MATRIGINGFGRIGRFLTRLLAYESDLELVAINARASNDTLAHLLKYDSVHGRFQGEVDYDDEGLIINGRHVAVTRKNIGEWCWGDYSVDLTVETTGAVKERDLLEKHIGCGAKKALISAPGKDCDCTVVMGVNDNVYDPAKHDVVSNASCTTNCLAPPAKVLNDTFGIKHGLMTTIHSYTMSQRILDGSHKDLRRGRAACMSMIPTTTGAAKALAMVVPELKGVIDGGAIRVPTPNVSLVDLTCELKKSTSIEEVNAALKEASEGYLKGIMGYTDEPLVSIDFVSSPYAGVVDSMCTGVIGGTMCKIIVWYDNEGGYTNQLLRFCKKILNTML
jgi:glyceraldehyde 3-phosphate dehydrogenase